MPLDIDLCCNRTWKQLKTHCGVHDSCAMCTDRVGDVADVDCVKMLVVAGVLYEDLVVQVVLVLRHKDVNVTHDFQNVQTLKTF